MAKSKKKQTKVSEHDSVTELRAFATNLLEVNIPAAQQDRFGPQIQRVADSLNKKADILQKAVNLEAKKAERASKAGERKVARIKRLNVQLEKIQKAIEAEEN